MSAAEAEGVVLLIGCGWRPYREYLLASAASRHPLWLFAATEPTWQRDHVRGSTVLADFGPDTMLAAARRLAQTAPILGVLSWDEALIVQTARLAHRLGLPGAGVAGIEGCRDKPLTRRLLTAAGLPQPRFAYVRDEADAVAAAERFGYPVVIKPRAGGASIGVMLAADTTAAREAFRVAAEASLHGSPAYAGGALVEEYLAGPEISIDAAVADGDYQPLFLARKTVGMAPFFEELGHVVDAGDPLLADPELIATLAVAHRAIGFRYGVTHTEVKLTTRGPVIVEINGRLGGDLIPLLGRYATGIEPGAVAVELALGRRPQIERGSGGRCVGIRFGYPPSACVVDRVSVPEPAADKGVLAAAALAEPGEFLALPPTLYASRHAYVICSGADPAECAVLLDKALAEVQLTARPKIPAATAGSAPSARPRPIAEHPQPDGAHLYDHT
ncbi:MAG TPA: ATP-grasp domain-containing protein [Actinocrinis sp.]|nr:ATP-grasp domain-containing protein [Actinospica sp.]HEU5426828.1 ATP-grasp domain-containing protein [Actinocrinis sp.]